MEMSLRFHERRGNMYLLWLHTDVDPPQEEWDRAFAQIVAYKEKTPGALDKMRMLVVTDGGGPNMKQRGMLFAKILEGKDVKSSAITTSLSNPLKRGLVKAILWTNSAFKAVGPDQWVEALAHIDLPAERSIFDELEPLQAGLKPVQTLALLRAR